jgi:RNA polymerase sigma-70 factor (sigma-E family)
VPALRAVNDIAGDDFGAFVSARHSALLRFAVVLTGDGRLAEEIVADVLAKAYERRERILAMDAPLAYVRRMIVNEYLSWRRRVRRTFPSPVVDELAGVEPDHATAHSERAEMHSRLARLPVRQRACLVLRYYEDVSDETIAEILGCAVGTVRSNISRALANLRVELTMPSAGVPTSLRKDR